MATIYTKRLGFYSWSSAGQVTLFTAGSDEAVVVRDLVLHNGTATPGQMYFYVASGSSSYILWRLDVPGSATVHLELRQRMEPGDQLIAVNTLANATAVATGYVFDLV